MSVLQLEINIFGQTRSVAWSPVPIEKDQAQPSYSQSKSVWWSPLYS
ncbi:hypothetical protein [Chroococcidiopsis sp. TS-821]|nr:hypothetical protein [Chroococcidiopsis sp. TS-821]